MRFAVVVSAASLLLVAGGCGSVGLDEPSASRPNVVLVSIDTLHVDWTSPYNPEITTTPFLGRFASEGTRFSRAYTQVPITLPSHASLMTGVSPRTLGVFANGDQVPASAVTLAERLAAAGYRTAGFPSLGVLRPAFGLDQGFDDYRDPFLDGPRRWYRTADEVLARVDAWMSENARAETEAPFFLWVHFSDPHEPYLPVGAPPDTELFLDDERLDRFTLVSGERFDVSLTLPPGRHRLRFMSLREPRPDDRPETAIVLQLAPTDTLARYAVSPEVAPGTYRLKPEVGFELRNPGAEPVAVELRFSGVLERPTPEDVMPHYEAEVAYTDAHLEKLDALLQRRGVADETLVAIVSDHGEGLFHHDFLGHTTHVYEDQLQVVWIMRGPGVPEGRTVDEASARLTDVAPTVLELLGLGGDTAFEGRSWAPCFRGERCPREEVFWAFGLEHDPRQLTMMAAYDGRYKWIWQRSLGRSAYDLAADPRESNDLLLHGGPDNPEPLKRLAESFPEARRSLNEGVRAARAGISSPGSETEDMLESLGYITRPR